MNDLYRKEAVEHGSRRLLGAVVLATPLSTKLLSLAALVVVATIVTFLSLARFSQKETVAGWIVPEGGLMRVVARQGGVVERLDVTEGEVVDQGAKLVSLRLSLADEQGDLGDRIDAGLVKEAAAVDARTTAGLERLRLEQSQLQVRGRSIAAELDETRQRTSMQAERVRLANDEVERGVQIAEKGFLTRRDLDARRSDALAAADYLGQLRSQILRLERELQEVQARARSIHVDEDTVRAEDLGSRAQLSQREAEAAGGNLQFTVAPRQGRVAALPFAQGQTVPAGAAVAVLTRNGAPLGAELYIPSKAAGFISPGQDVRLMYAAFPYQKFGAGHGVVESVSRTVLAPGDVSVPGLAVQEPVFRVRVRLASSEVQAYGRAIPLQPGMLLTADVVTSRRSLLEWLFDPLFAAGRRA